MTNTKEVFRASLEHAIKQSGKSQRALAREMAEDEAGIKAWEKKLSRWVSEGLGRPNIVTKKELLVLCQKLKVDYYSLWKSDEEEYVVKIRELHAVWTKWKLTSELVWFDSLHRRTMFMDRMIESEPDWWEHLQMLKAASDTADDDDDDDNDAADANAVAADVGAATAADGARRLGMRRGLRGGRKSRLLDPGFAGVLANQLLSYGWGTNDEDEVKRKLLALAELTPKEFDDFWSRRGERAEEILFQLDPREHNILAETNAKADVIEALRSNECDEDILQRLRETAERLIRLEVGKVASELIRDFTDQDIAHLKTTKLELKRQIAERSEQGYSSDQIRAWITEDIAANIPEEVILSHFDSEHIEVIKDKSGLGDAELRDWIAGEIAKGCSNADILEEICRTYKVPLSVADQKRGKQRFLRS
jgi:hypothetical protein